MKHPTVFGGVVAALLVLAAMTPALAQTDTGAIDGRVLDESRAAVPGATITAKNNATGLARTAVSSALGTFHIAGIPAGLYDVTAELAGFATSIHKEVEIQIGSATTVDVTMKVARVAETITVTGESPLVQTSRSDVGQVINAKIMENLPLNGRKFQDLALLVPGTRPSNYYDPTKTEVGGISYGGLSGRAVIINVDGGDNNDGVVRGLLQQYSAEAIQEYKVTTQRYSAEFGRSVGGVVNVVTKSGTNEFRGSGFLFARSDKLNAKTFFEKQQGLDKQPFKQQQFGGSVGGPISRDHAHFFFAYERNNRDDFAIVNTNGVLPSQEGAFPKPFRNDLPTAKVDFELAPGNTLIARYARENNRRQHDFIGGSTLSSSGAHNTNVIDSFIVKDTAVIGTGTLNEILVSYSKFENNITADDNTRPGIATPDFFFGANLNTPQQTIQKRLQVKEDLSFRKSAAGDHDFKTGAELLRTHFGGFFTPTLYGFFNFSKSFGSNLNAYLNGFADTFTGSAGDNAFDDNWTYAAAYFQDDWKPNTRLTVNLGLRYEIQTGPYLNNHNTLPIQALKAAGSPGARTQDKNNFGPRVGFAFDVAGDGRTVLKGGFGRYYDEIFQNITLYEYWSDVAHPTIFISTTPTFTPNQFAASRDAIRASYANQLASQLQRLTSPKLQQPYANHFNIGLSHELSNTVSFDFDYVRQKGYAEIHRWRINTAQNVSTLLSPAGQFAPAIGPILVEGNRGHSQFDGFYVTGKVRTAKISVLSSYALTYAKNIGNDFNSQPADITNANWDLDYNWTPNDIRHRFTTGAVFPLPSGFQYSTSVQANTGKPFSASAGLGGLRNAVRATNPATGQMFPRDSFRAGSFFSWDMRVSKFIPVGGQKKLELLFEVFNLTNHVNYNRDDYTFRFASSQFGKPTAIVPNSQRQAEFGARFTF